MKKIFIILFLSFFSITSLLFLLQFKDYNRMFNAYSETTIKYNTSTSLNNIMKTIDASNEYDCFDYNRHPSDDQVVTISCTKIMDVQKFITLFDDQNATTLIKHHVFEAKVEKELLNIISIVFSFFVLSLSMLVYLLFKILYPSRDT